MTDLEMTTVLAVYCEAERRKLISESILPLVEKAKNRFYSVNN